MKSLNALMAALVVELIEGEIPSPLTQSLPVFALWSDLARLAGEALPPHVAALLDAPAVECLADGPRQLVPTAHRGSFAAWEGEFFHEEPA